MKQINYDGKLPLNTSDLIASVYEENNLHGVKVELTYQGEPITILRGKVKLETGSKFIGQQAMCESDYVSDKHSIESLLNSMNNELLSPSI
jgi:hypothetical protein